MGIRDAIAVGRVQDQLLEALRMCVQLHARPDTNIFAKLLMKVSEVRASNVRARGHHGPVSHSAQQQPPSSALPIQPPPPPAFFNRVPLRTE